jgi:hypothetical protein
MPTQSALPEEPIEDMQNFNSATTGDATTDASLAHGTSTALQQDMYNDNVDDDSLLGGEPCLLDRKEEMDKVRDMLSALTNEERAALSDPAMAVRHLRATKVSVGRVVH